MTGYKLPKFTMECAVCGVPFASYQKRRRFCSCVCSHFFRRWSKHGIVKIRVEQKLLLLKLEQLERIEKLLKGNGLEDISLAKQADLFAGRSVRSDVRDRRIRGEMPSRRAES